MQDELKQHLQVEADKNGRSLNAEIVHRLEGSFVSIEKRSELNRQLLETTQLVLRYELLRAKKQRTKEDDAELRRLEKQIDKEAVTFFDVPPKK